jgi:AAA family ATP:ADP antiporter
MASLTQRLLDVREGEARPAFAAGLTLSLMIASHTMLETARDALFLGKLDASRLPLVYLLLAGLSFLVSRMSAALSRRFGRRNALVFSLLVSAYGTALLHFRPLSEAVVFGLYVWTGVLGTVLVLQFWMFAAQLFTVSQGKRLYGPIAAGGVVGAVIGASLAAALVRLWPVAMLLLVSSGLFMASATLLTTVPTDEAKPPAADPAGAGRVRRGVGTLSASPYLKRVGVVVVFSTAAVLTTDYLFKSVAKASIPAEELPQFFATYYAGLNAVALVVQVLLVSRLVRRLGVTGALLVLPVLISLGGAAAAASAGAVGIVLLLKGADGAFRHSLHRVSMELLYMPVSADERDRAKPVLDVAFGRGTQAVTAAAILVLATVGWGTPRVLAVVTAVLAAGWLLSALSLRRPYVDLFRRALARGQLDATARLDDLNLSSVEAVMEALSSPDEGRVIAAMDILSENGRARLIPGLIFYHDSEEVLEHALSVVASRDRADWIPLVERLQSHRSPRVRAAALSALAGAGVEDAVRKGLLDDSAAVRAKAAFFLCNAADERHPEDNPLCAVLLDETGERGLDARLAFLEAIRDHGDPRWIDVLLRIARDAPSTMAPHVARAVSRVPDPRFIPILVRALRTRDGRGAVRDALVALGDDAFLALEQALEEPTTEPEVKLHIPSTLARFETQAAVDALVRTVSSEQPGALRFRALVALGRLVKRDGLAVDRDAIYAEVRRNALQFLELFAKRHLLAKGQEEDPLRANDSGEVVLGLLDDKLRQSLDRATRLLQIAHRREDLRGVSKALSSDDPRRRATALEFLDVLTATSPDTRELVRLMVDELTPSERVQRAQKHVRALPADYEEALARLLDGPDDSMAALAAFHAMDLGLIGLRARIRSVFRDRPGVSEMGPPSILPPSVSFDAVRGST